MLFRKRQETVFLPAENREGSVRRKDRAFATARAAENRLSASARRRTEACRTEERRARQAEALFAVVRFASRRMPAQRAERGGAGPAGGSACGGIRTLRARLEGGCAYPHGQTSRGGDCLDEAISALSRLRGLNRDERGE